MTDFLFWIGAYNALGSLFLFSFVYEPFAARVLGLIEVTAEPYTHGPYGLLWVLWAASTNLALGGVMVAASYWSEEVQRVVTLMALLPYASGIVMILGLRSKRYRKSGLITCLFLWVAQMAWGLYGVF